MDETGEWVEVAGRPRLVDAASGYDLGGASYVYANKQHAAMADAALVALIKRDAARSEPLPTMTGAEIADALRGGFTVEVMQQAGNGERPKAWVPLATQDAPHRYAEAWEEHGPTVVVARVMESPKPATEEARAEDLRPGMVRVMPDGEHAVIDWAQRTIDVNGDTVEVWFAQPATRSRERMKASVLVSVLVPSEEQGDRT